MRGTSSGGASSKLVNAHLLDLLLREDRLVDDAAVVGEVGREDVGESTKITVSASLPLIVAVLVDGDGRHSHPGALGANVSSGASAPAPPPVRP